MTKKSKKLFGGILALAMFASAGVATFNVVSKNTAPFAVTTITANAEEEEQNGTADHPWKIGATKEDGVTTYDVTAYLENGTLYIKGEGAMGSSPWDSNGDITAVEIGKNITTIAGWAFDECENLETVTFEAGSVLQSIGEYAFYGCSSLTEITIPASVTEIGDGAFYECENLETVTFEENSVLQEIGEYAFYGCSSLKEITIPASVTSILQGAFESCENLETVTFEENSVLQEIGEYAFEYCYALKEITIPASVTEIGGGAFYECENLETVTFEAGSVLQEIGEYAFEYCYALKEITIPASVTEIGGGAFYECKNLETVTFEEGSALQSIGEYAFEYCYALKEITIPASVTSILQGAFESCENLKTVTFEAGSVLQEIGEYAFEYCYALKEITIPANVTEIGGGAFYACKKLKTVTFEENSALDKIGYGAFEDCYALKEITIPASVTEINRSAFSYCESLVAIEFTGVTPPTLVDCMSIHDLIYDSYNAIIVVPDSWDLNELDELGNLTVLKNDSYYKVGKDDDVIIAFVAENTLYIKGVGAMKDFSTTNAPWYNKEINAVEIGEGVTAIGENAFAGIGTKENRAEIYSYIDIGNPFFGQEFNGILLKGYAPDEEGSWYGGYFNVEGSKDFPWNVSATEADNVTAYLENGTLYLKGTGAMKDYDYNEEFTPWFIYIIISSDMEELDMGILDIEIDDGITRIGKTAFMFLSIKEITIPASVKEIGDVAFLLCPYLRKVTFAANSQIESIGYEAFGNCNNLAFIEFEGEPENELPVVCSNLFENTSLENVILLLPESWDVDKYGKPNSTTGEWLGGKFLQFENEELKKWDIGKENENDVTAIFKFEGTEGILTISGSGYMCDSLDYWDENDPWYDIHVNYAKYITSIIIEQGVKNIGNWVFGDFGALTNVTIPEGVEYIGKYAFYKCYNLEEVTIPANIEYIGEEAFAYCIGLTSVRFLGNPCDNFTWEDDVFDEVGLKNPVKLYLPADWDENDLPDEDDGAWHSGYFVIAYDDPPTPPTPPTPPALLNIATILKTIIAVIKNYVMPVLDQVKTVITRALTVIIIFI